MSSNLFASNTNKPFSFSFGAPAATTIIITASTTTSNAPLFSSGSSSTTAGSGLFGFTPTSTSGTTSFGFTLPKPTATSAGTNQSTTVSQGFSFALPATSVPSTTATNAGSKPSGGLFGTALTPVTTTSAPSGFSLAFSAVPTSTTTQPAASQGFSFGLSVVPKTTQASTSAPATVLSGGIFASASTAPSSGFSFSTSTTGAFSTAQTGGTTQPAASKGFSFGTPAVSTASTTTTSAPGLGGGLFSSTTATATSTSAASGFSFLSATTPSSGTTQAVGSTIKPSASQGFSFGLTAVSTAPTTTNVAAAPAIASGLFGATSTAPSGLAGSGFTFSSNLTPAVTTTHTATTTHSAAPQGFSFGASMASSVPSTTSAATPGLGSLFGDLTSSTKLPVASTTSLVTKPLDKPISTASATSSLQTTAAGVAQAPSESVQKPVAQQKPLTYEKLEELINKWALEVEEQERLFLAQAEQINAWDRILMENGDKILELNDFINNLEGEHLRIDHELEFVVQQQSELSQILDQLEKVVNEDQDATSGQLVGFYGAAQREEMVQEQVMLDSQLKRIGQELEDISDKVECMTRGSATDDPMKQIAQVLSKQMDALQLISEQTNEMSNKVCDVKNVLELRRKQQAAFANDSRFS